MDNDNQMKTLYSDEQVKSILEIDALHIVRVTYDIYKHIYKFTGTVWFVFNFDKHRWCNDKNGILLRKDIINDQTMIIQCKLNHMVQKSVKSIDDTKNEHYKKSINHARRIIHLLKTSRSFMNKIMKECSKLFFDETFEEQLNNNPNINRFQEWCV